jgi:SAM-dependent methyltransferase
MPQDPFFLRFFPNDQYGHEAFHRQLRQRLPLQGKVLDLGCGSNAQMSHYRTPQREVWGTDFIPHTRLRHPTWFRPLGERGRIPFPDSTFDLISSCMVLEHVDSPRTFLLEVHRALRPGGFFVALTVHADHYFTWFKKILTLLPHFVTQKLVHRLYGREEEDTFPTYYRLNSRSMIERWARLAGLHVAGWETHANQGYFQFSRPLQKMAVLADAFVERLWPGHGRLYLILTLCNPLAARHQAA